jgi:succinyl-CoA synthetase beta subunit
MRLHEYEAADIFNAAGIPVPARAVAATPEEAQKIAEDLGCPVVLKAQVLVGGRGLAGGVKIAASPVEVYTLSDDLLGREIKGFPVRKLLVSKRVTIDRELYLGITVDGYEGKPVVLVSEEGGMSIDRVAERRAEKIASLHVDIDRGFFPYEARGIFRKLGFSSQELLSAADILVRLYHVFQSYSALIAEINPLTVTPDGSLIAVDAVLEVDDSALFRVRDHLPLDQERIENPLERKGKELGVTYVDLDGDIGIISSGAGLGMATMDIIARKRRPANFLETGGGITEQLLYKSIDLVMMKPGIRGVFVNIYGGINPIHEGARGIVRYMNEMHVRIPVVAKALGNRQEETWDILRAGGVHVVTDVATEKAVDRLFELLGT